MSAGAVFRKVFPSYYGFGLIWGVLYACFSTPSFFGVVGFTRTANDAFNLSVVPTMVVTCLLVALLASRGFLKPYRLSRHIPTLATVLSLCILFFGSFVVGLVPGGATALLVAAGVLGGFGFSILLTGWREAFTFELSEDRVLHFVYAGFLGTAVTTLLVYLPSTLAFVVGLASLILADYLLGDMRKVNQGGEALGIHGASQSSEAEQGNETEGVDGEVAVHGKSGIGIRSIMSGRALQIIAPSLFFACVLEALFTSSSQIALAGSRGFASNNIFNIAILLSGLVLIAAVKLKKDSYESISFYDIVFLVVGGAFLMLPFMGSDWGVLLAAIVVACVHIVSALLTIILIGLVRNLDADAYLVFSLQEACLQVSAFIGVLLTFVVSGGELGLMQLLLIAFASIYALGVVLAFMVRRLSTKKTAEFAGPTMESLAVAKLDESQKAELAKLAEQIFEERCAELSTEGGLTQRESDVFFCLARGLSIEKTAEELMVSINTVKTHAKMVYAKLDIHSRQDLIALIRDEEVPS